MVDMLRDDPGWDIACQESYYHNMKMQPLLLGIWQVLRTQQLRQSIQEANDRNSLAHCLAVSSQSDATNPKDKIYGLGDLIDWKQVDDRPKVEYGNSYPVAELFASTARVLLREDPVLAL